MTKSGPSLPPSAILSAVLSSALALAVTGVLGKRLHLWEENFLLLIPSATSSLVLSLILIAGALLLGKRRGQMPSVNPWVFAVFMVVIFASDWLTRSYNLLQGPSIRGEIILFTILSFFLIGKRANFVFSSAALLTAVVLIGTFLQSSAGRLLFMDDHTSFFYRLSLLKENFPFIPFYDPQWNGGVDSRDYFATGSLNVFLLFSPLIYLFDLADTYNLIVITIMFVLTPGAVYYASRLAGFPAPAPAISAILSVTGSLLWYRWALQYGTVGFITTMSLIPLNMVLAVKILSTEDNLTRGWALFSVFTFTMMLFWAPSGLVFIPAIIISLFQIKRLIMKKHVRSIMLLLVMINVPWMLLFWSISGVSRLIQNPDYFHPNSSISREILEKDENVKVSKLRRLSIPKSLKVVRDAAISTNPLILIFAIPGFFMLERRMKIIFGSTALWLVFLGSICVPINPRLELDRMLLVLAFLSSLPCGLCIGRLINEAASGESRIRKALVSLACGFLFTGIFSSAAVLMNRSLVQFAFASPQVEDMSGAIKKYHSDARILYTGFVLHELSEGHLAPLAVFTKVPLLASSHVHNQWKYKQIFPQEFLSRKDEGIEEYLDLYNAAAAFAHEKYWKEYFAARPEKYTKVWESGRFQLFTRNNFKSSYFYRGEGEFVGSNTNSFSFRTSKPDAVLKFNYFPFLRSDACRLSPYKITEEISLIQVSDCPVNTTVTVRSGPAYLRFKKF